jgi:hypothetical protein
MARQKLNRIPSRHSRGCTSAISEVRLARLTRAFIAISFGPPSWICGRFSYEGLPELVPRTVALNPTIAFEFRVRLIELRKRLSIGEDASIVFLQRVNDHLIALIREI